MNPFKISVFDKGYVFRGFVGDPQSVSVNVRHNQQGTASLTIAGSHRMVAALTAPGARVLIEHRPWPSKRQPRPVFEFLMSGYVTGSQGQGPAAASSVTVQIADDIQVLSEIEGWPVPGSAISSQSASEYATYTGVAETVLKNAVSANLGHGVNHLSVAADQGRGSTVPGGVAFRFHSLAEKLLPAVDAAGVGVQVRQSGTGRVLDVYVPRTYPHILSEKAGTITDWSWSADAPKATRAVGGGKGEGTARAFAQYIDTAAESELGRSIETFKDATDVSTTADLQARAKQEVADNGPKYGFSVKLSESGMFQYGENGVRVGDLVTVDIGGQTRTDVLRECTLAFNRESGPTQTPVIGDIDQSPEKKLGRLLTKLIRAASNQNKR